MNFELGRIVNMLEAGESQAGGDKLNEYLTGNPDDVDALVLMGRLLMRTNNMGSALAFFQRAAQMNPDSWQIWTMLGSCEAALQRPEHALAALDVAYEQEPGNPRVLEALAHAHTNLYNFEKAVDFANKALMREECVQAYVARAFVRLHQRRWKEGWKDYHKGLGYMQWREKHDYGLPEWNGQDDGDIVVYAEQGLGDQLAFLGAIKKHFGDRVSQINCHRKIAKLVERSFPQTEVYGQQHDTPVTFVPNGKYQVNMAGAMRFIDIKDGHRYDNDAFLDVHPAKKIQWGTLVKSTMRDEGKDKAVGIGWTGGRSGSCGSRSRNISLDNLYPLIKMLHEEGYLIVSLQHQEQHVRDAEEFALKYGIKIHDWNWATRTADLDDFVALQSALDRVICVPTTAYHIAGALGQQCDVLVHDAPHFHEGVAGSVSPWWETVRLWRGENRVQALYDEILNKEGLKVDGEEE